MTSSRPWISALVAAAIAASPAPASAETTYYFRNVSPNAAAASGSTAPGAGTDSIGGAPSAGTDSTGVPGMGGNSGPAQQQVTQQAVGYPATQDGTIAQSLPVPAGQTASYWQVTSGSLPPGVTLDQVNGIIQGQPSGQAGTYVATVTAYDGTGNPVTAVNTAVDVTPTAVPVTRLAASGRVSKVIRLSVNATPAAATFAVFTGSALPPGVGIDYATGVVSGYPTAPGTYPNVAIVGQDANGVTVQRSSVDFTVAAAPSIAAVRDQILSVAQPFSYQPTVSNAVAPVSWTVSGSLPQGVSLDPGTGAISGQVNAPGTNAAVSLAAVDAQGLVAYSNTFIVGTPDQVVGSISSIPNFTSGLGSSFSATLSGSNFSGTPAWDVDTTGGPLPPGLALNARGMLSGQPTQAGTYPNIRLTVVTTAGERATSNTFTFTVIATPTLAAPTPNPFPARTGKYYALPFTATPGNRSFGYAMTGTLPPGMSYNAQNGIVSGVPTAPGIYAGLTMTASDGYGLKASAAFEIDVSQGLQLSYPAFPSLRQGRYFSATASTGNPSGAVAYRIASAGNSYNCPYWQTYAPGQCPTSYGALPPGIAFDASSGTFSGTPSNAAQWWALVNAVDADGSSATANVVSGPVASAPTLSYAANTATAPGTNVTLNPSVANNLGTVAYDYAPGSATLPAGITLNKATGVISGSTSALGTYLVTVAATDTDGLVATSNQVRIAVTNAPDIYLGQVPAMKVGRPWTMTATVGNATGAVTWGNTGLPAWVTNVTASGANNTTLTLTGTPTSTTAVSFSLTAKDPRNVTTTSSPIAGTPAAGNVVSAVQPSKWRQGLSSWMQPAISANAVAPVAWSAAGLPSGLSIDPATGRISGYPGPSGSFPVTISTTDAEGTVATLAQTFAVQAGPTVTYGGNKAFFPNDAVSVLPATTGLQGAPTYTLNGTLPPGMIFNPDGSITGTAGASGTGTATVTLTDGADGSSSTSPAFTLAITSSNFVVSVGTSQTGQAYQALSFAPQALLRSQVVQQYVDWTLIGTLPNGLRFDALSGTVSGTPTGPSTTTLRFQAVYGSTSAYSDNVTLTVADRPALAVTLDNPTPPAVRQGTAYTLVPTAQNAMGNVRWNLTSGPLPNGLSLDPATGIVSGRPASVGSYTITLQATDANRSATAQSVSLQVVGAMTASYAVQTSSNRVGKGYLATPTTPGSSGAVTWALTTGTLPPGLAFSTSDGSISGLPTTDGSVTVAATATDATGATAVAGITVTVAKGPSIAAIPNMSAPSTGVTTYAPSASNTVSTLAWSWNDDVNAPAWLTINPSNGTISATNPATAGTTNNLRVKLVDGSAADGNGLVAVSNAFSLTVESSATLQVSLPPTVNLVHGQAVTVTPAVTGATGPVTYQLQAYTPSQGYSNGCYNAGTMWWPQGSGSNSCTYNAYTTNPPAGITFSTSTGKFSGVPTTAQTVPANANYAPSAYRIMATSGGKTAYSNQIVFTAQEWAQPTISIPSNVTLTRGKAVTIPATVQGTIGSVTYQLQAYTQSQGYSNGCYNYGIGWWQQGTGSNSCTYNAYTTNPPSGLVFSTGTGAFSGTPDTAGLVPTNATFAPSAYRIVATESRPITLADGSTTTQQISFTSNEITFTAQDWAQPTISLPSNVTLTRGVAASVTPVVMGVTGSVTYQLQAYTPSQGYANGCYNAGTAWWPQGSGSNSCTYNAYTTYPPSGLVFSTATGAFSGTPDTAGLVPTNANFAPSAYRIMMTETRNVTRGDGSTSAQTNVAYSNQVAFTAQDWAPLQISVDQTVKLSRGVPVTVQPTVTGNLGSVTYQLQAYTLSQSYANGCYNAGTGWWPQGTGSNSCTYNAYTTNPPSGLVFSTSTGTFSGTPDTAGIVPTNANFAPSAYRIVATENRSVKRGDGSTSVQTLTAYSQPITFVAQDWTQPTISIPTDYQIVPGQSVSIAPATTGVTGSVTYQLQAYTPSQGYSNGCYNAGTGWWPQGSGSNSCTYNAYTTNPPAGITFSTSTGAFTGTGGSTVTPTSANYPPTAYRIMMTETRNVTRGDGSTSAQTNVAYSNQISFKLRSGAAPATGLDYGSGLAARVGDTVSWKPTVTGGTPGTYSIAFGTQSLGALSTGEVSATALPNGLSFDPPTGAIYGTIGANGVSGNVARSTGLYRGIQVCATVAGTKTCDVEVPIRVTDRALPTLDTPPYPTGTVGQQFQMLPVLGGTAVAPLTFSLSTGQTAATDNPQGDRVLTALPSGLGFTSDGGFTGIPSAAGTYRGYKVTVTDATGYSATSNEIVVRVLPEAPLAVSFPANASLSEGVPVSGVTAQASNVVGTLTWLAPQPAGTALASSTETVGSLPGGVTWSTSAGALQGAPAVGSGGKTYRGLSACARDDRGVTACSGEWALQVGAYPAAAVSVPQPANGTAYATYQNQAMAPIQATASNTVGAFTFATAIATGRTTVQPNTGEIVQSSLPAGLTYANGQISGTPTGGLGRYRGYAICGTDSGRAGTTCSGEIVIDVLAQPAMTLTMPTVIDAKAGTLLADVAPTVANANGTVTFATAPTFNASPVVSNPSNGDVQQGSLPSGLTYRGSATGAVGGTPASPGTSPIRYRGYKVCGTDQSSPAQTACSNEFTFTVRP